MPDHMPSPLVIESAMLKVISIHKMGMHTKDLEKGVADFLELSQELQEITRADKRGEFGYRLAWARTKAKGKGHIERIDHATWRITEAGLEYLKLQEKM